MTILTASTSSIWIHTNLPGSSLVSIWPNSFKLNLDHTKRVSCTGFQLHRWHPPSPATLFERCDNSKLIPVSLLGRDESDASDHRKIVKTRCFVRMGPQHSHYRDGLEDRIYAIIQIYAAISLFVVFKQGRNCCS